MCMHMQISLYIYINMYIYIYIYIYIYVCVCVRIYVYGALQTTQMLTRKLAQAYAVPTRPTRKALTATQRAQCPH